jgi:CSLREA domain-containing protein
MQHRLRFLLPLIVLAACRQEQPLTGPTETGDVVESHAPGHKVVNSLADPGNGICNAAQCTLREAINDPRSTEISFAPGLTGTITLATPGEGGGRLEIDKPLTIAGPGAGITIRRRSTDPAFRTLSIESGATVALTNLTIRGAKPVGPGGAILNHGRLALTSCKVVGNFTSGINSVGPLTLANSTVANNAEGGISAKGNTVTLTNSTVTGNAGTGLYGEGTITIDNSTISNNAGGIWVAAGILTVRNSLVSRNTGRGIVLTHFSRMTLDHLRIVHNSGGGIFLRTSSGTLTNSTVAHNSAGDGGGIVNHTGRVEIAGSTIMNNSASGQGGGILNTVDDPTRRKSAGLTLTNSTVSGNSAESGGGIANSAERSRAHLRLTNSTVTRNSATQRGGGVFQTGESFEDDLSSLTVTNSLLAQNSAPTGPEVYNVVGDFGPSFNLIGDGSDSGVSDGVDGNQVGSAEAPIDPKLGPLGDNGGPTRTHRLLPGSPAIDAASTPDCPPTDQRGVPRPQGAGCDIGSFERK